MWVRRGGGRRRPQGWHTLRHVVSSLEVTTRGARPPCASPAPRGATAPIASLRKRVGQRAGRAPLRAPRFCPDSGRASLRIVLQAGAWSRGLPVTQPQVRVFPPAAGAHTPIVTGTLFLHR